MSMFRMTSQTLAVMTGGLLLLATGCGGQAAPSAPASASSSAPASAKPASSSAPAASSASASASAAPSSASPKAGLKKVVLGLAVSPPNVVHIVPFVAKDMGYFEQEGLDVDIQQFQAGGTQALRGNVAGGVDVAWADGTSTMVAAARGAGDKIIMSPAPKLDLTMVSQPNIASINDLKGKKMGLSGEVGGLIDFMNRLALQKAGIDPKDVQFIQTTTAGRVAGLVEKKTDTAVVHVDQALTLEQKEPTVKSLAQMWDVAPDFYYAVLAAQQKVYDADPKTFEGIVRAMIKADRFILQNKDKTAEITEKYTKLPKDVISKTYDDLKAGNVWSVNGGLDQKKFDYTADLLVSLGALKANEKPAYDKTVEPKFVTAALASLGKQGSEP